MTRNKLNAAVTARLEQINDALEPLDDKVAAELATLFPMWAVGVSYETGARRQYDEKLYKCVQAHVSQEGWEPPNVQALWTEIAKPGEIPVWKQPTGAQDAYMAGDKVHYPTESDSVYASNIDNNVWEPGVYGWELVE